MSRARNVPAREPSSARKATTRRGGSFGQVKVVGFADRRILSGDAVQSFAKRTMLLRHVNLLPRPAKRMPPCRRRSSYCAADNRGLREASPEARHRSPTAEYCRCFAADQRAAYPPGDWFDGTKDRTKTPDQLSGAEPGAPGADADHCEDRQRSVVQGHPRAAGTSPPKPRQREERHSWRRN